MTEYREKCTLLFGLGKVFYFQPRELCTFLERIRAVKGEVEDHVLRN